ncbi:MAG: ABC transporter permease [Actinomycetia bacterium]|nr:ABC transporter permease [Actinomycetes bacterium]
MHVETDVGASRLIAGQVPTALAPGREELVVVKAAPDPTQVRNRVEGDINALFIVLGSVSLLVGAIGIANVTLVSVLERRGEIGLRRAVGAARRHIASQFLVESTLLGALGGLIGTSAGILLIVGVSAARDWTPVLEPWLPFIAPIAGALVGLLAGVYPALKAANTEPIAALRG